MKTFTLTIEGEVPDHLTEQSVDVIKAVDLAKSAVMTILDMPVHFDWTVK